MELIKKDGLLGKIKTIISLLYGIIIWVAKLSCSIKITPYHCLGVLISSSSQLLNTGARRKIHFETEAPPSPSLASSSSSCFALSSTGDFIGSESGVYLSSTEEALSKPYVCFQKKKNQNQEVEQKRELPPPMPSLVGTENLACRVPWVFARHYVDGRLIVKEKRAKRYEYFETYRENGRLIMKLITLDGTFECCHSVSEVEDNEDLRAENDEKSSPFSCDIERKEENEVVDEMEQIESSMFKSFEDKRSKKERKKTMSKPSFFSVPVPVNRPITI